MSMSASISSTLSILFLVSILKAVDGGGIGVSYGRSATNLPPPAQVAQFLAHSTTFDRVKLFDADPAAVQAFANTDLAVDITVPNNLIANLTDLRFARRWVRANIAPHVDDVNIARILLGNEVVSTANRKLISALVPAMQNLHTALIGLSLQHRIKVAAPQSLAVLAASDPPSAGKFKDGYAAAAVMKPLLSFLRATASPFMVNAYPFFGFTIDTLDYALFRASAGGGVVDESTGGVYSNMLDAQLDAVFSAMKRLGFADVDIVVAETGWPSAGDPWEVGVNVDNAREYNKNLVEHVASGVGTPLQPNRTFEAYVFSLFNENLKPGPLSERNFGLFRADMVPVYDIGVLKTEVGGQEGSNAPVQVLNPTLPSKADSKKWCVPKPNTEMLLLQENIEYVCGQSINCEPIQPGGMCYFPDTVAAHASFLMNEYYQAFGRNDFDCDFGQTGMITTIDPSYGTCIYSS
ncbi:glucan endo-1,3-beta-glucosidase [Canna indica]|uniref:glucan endo-1,3-beta-D-glucosidase n=1 Tax=Canna indica TaxID=4628 RepID=A0AAQ3JRN3_9LILI|nr:glucan endo-1,3-beta-glucosidase [Canna indica]